MITLTGEPKSTQTIYRYACRGSFPTMYMTKVGKDIKEQYSLEAKSQWKKEPIKGDIKMWVTLYFGTKRVHDIDNFSKLLLDSLTGIVYEDDVQIQELHIKKEFDKSNPRIELETVEI